jgi:predicted dehydrogenase
MNTSYEDSAPSVALIGCGRWGSLILRDLKALGCRVPVVARSEDSRRYAIQGKADGIYPNVVELIAHEDLSGAVIATPASTHFTVIFELASSNPTIPIFVEKPATCSVKHAYLLSEQFPDRIFVMDKWRYHAGVKHLASMVREQALGKVYGIRTERLGWGMPHNDANALWHLLPHDLAIIQEMLGAIPVFRSSQVQRTNGMAYGGIIQLGDQPWVSCSISAHHPERRRRIQLVCEDGIAVLDDGYAKSIQVYRGALMDGDIVPSCEEVRFPNELPLFEELRTFCKYLSDRTTELKTPLCEAIPVIETIERALGDTL